MDKIKCEECNYCYSYYRDRQIKKICLLSIEHSDFDKPSPDWCPLKENNNES